MDLGALSLLVLIAPGLVGFTLMIVAFVMVARQGGWTQAMHPDPQGRWPLPRRLMCAGAGQGNCAMQQRQRYEMVSLPLETVCRQP